MEVVKVLKPPVVVLEVQPLSINLYRWVGSSFKGNQDKIKEDLKEIGLIINRETKSVSKEIGKLFKVTKTKLVFIKGF